MPEEGRLRPKACNEQFLQLFSWSNKRSSFPRTLPARSEGIPHSGSSEKFGENCIFGFSYVSFAIVNDEEEFDRYLQTVL